MKKLMMLAAALTIVGAVSGCGMFSSEGVKVNKSQYVRNGQIKAFTPDTALGGYIVGVTLGKEVTDKVFTNAVQSKSFTGRAYLLVGMDEVTSSPTK